jgi:hypothetical protein
LTKKIFNDENFPIYGTTLIMQHVVKGIIHTVYDTGISLHNYNQRPFSYNIDALHTISLYYFFRYMYTCTRYVSLTRVDWTVLDRRAHGRIERVRLEGGISTGPHGPTQQGVLLCSPQGGRPMHTEPRQVVGGGAPCLYGRPMLS